MKPESHTITDHRFFTSGNALFTVSNPKGDHYTFKIRQKKDKDGIPSPFFVSMLTGPDNWANYTYIGILNEFKFQMYTTAKSKMNMESIPVRVFNWALSITKNKLTNEMPEGYDIIHEGKCCRCGRLLTVPESVKSGIGPECVKYWNEGK